MLLTHSCRQLVTFPIAESYKYLLTDTHIIYSHVASRLSKEKLGWSCFMFLLVMHQSNVDYYWCPVHFITLHIEVYNRNWVINIHVGFSINNSAQTHGRVWLSRIMHWYWLINLIITLKFQYQGKTAILR